MLIDAIQRRLNERSRYASMGVVTAVFMRFRGPTTTAAQQTNAFMKMESQ